MNLSRDAWISILTFAAAVIALAAATLQVIPPNIQPFLTFAVGVINLALAIFFGVSKPIQASATRALNARRDMEQASKPPAVK